MPGATQSQATITFALKLAGHPRTWDNTTRSVSATISSMLTLPPRGVLSRRFLPRYTQSYSNEQWAVAHQRCSLQQAVAYRKENVQLLCRKGTHLAKEGQVTLQPGVH